MNNGENFVLFWKTQIENPKDSENTTCVIALMPILRLSKVNYSESQVMNWMIQMMPLPVRTEK